MKIKLKKLYRFWIIALLLPSIIQGCGSGNSGSTMAVSDSSANTTPTVNQGAITEFGSFFVNDIEFESSPDTKFFVDGNPADEGDLRKGMIVTVKGHMSMYGMSGMAHEVTSCNQVEGPIAHIDIPGSYMTVLGKKIVIDAKTIIKEHNNDRFMDADDDLWPPLTLADLAIDDMVRISGNESANDEIMAWRIERMPTIFQSDFTMVEIKGKVSKHVGAQMSFDINTLVVDYAQAMHVEKPLSDGISVVVNGTLDQAGNTITAYNVNHDDDPMGGGEAGHRGIEGLVTAIYSPFQFEVNGHSIDASSAEFLNGTPGDLELNKRIEVGGSMIHGSIIAEKIMF